MNNQLRVRKSTPRSRSGCLECRQRHQKCDEDRPACKLCRRFGRKCEYGLRLSWGGRPFNRSTFGKCMVEGVDKPVRVISTSSAPSVTNDSRLSLSFVYGIVESKEHIKQPSTALLQSQQRPRMAIAPSSVPHIPPAYSFLLDYFPHVVDSFSCSETVKKGFCETMIPMAFSTPHLMTSILTLAAVHRVSAGLNQSEVQLARLQVMAIEQLRSRLSNLSGSPTEDIMATVLMLCYADIVGGGDKLNAWRSHINGAACLFSRDISQWSIRSQNPTRVFISKCFISLVALANVSGYPPTDFVSTTMLQMASGSNPYIDEFTAYSTDLINVLSDIGALLRMAEIRLENNRIATGVHRRVLEKGSARIIWQLQSMIKAQSNLSKLDTMRLSSRQREYLDINEAYHHAALLQVYQRILGMPLSANRVQETVHRIISLISGVRLQQGPCPGIALLFPVFSAGCAAIEDTYREKVLALMREMAGLYGIMNVRHCIKILETLWSRQDWHRETQYRLSWRDLTAEETPDVIIY